MGKGFGVWATIILDYMSVAFQLVFVGDEPIQTYRSSWVEIARGDADFGTETIAKAVGKPGRGVPVTACRVDGFEEPLECRPLFRHYAVGVSGAVSVDVVNRLLQGVDCLDGEHQVAVFFAPVGGICTFQFLAIYCLERTKCG